MYSAFFKDQTSFVNKSSDRPAIRTTSARRPASELWVIVGRCWEDFAPLLFCQCMRATNTRHCRQLLHWFLVTGNFCVSWEAENVRANQKVLVCFCSNVYVYEHYVFFRTVQKWKARYIMKASKKRYSLLLLIKIIKKYLKDPSLTISVRRLCFIHSA